MAVLDKIHEMTKCLEYIVHKFDRFVDKSYDSRELREILELLKNYLDEDPAFKKSIKKCLDREKAKFKSKTLARKKEVEEINNRIKMLVECDI